VKRTEAAEGGRCLILAVETSCDETSAAVVENGRVVLSNAVSSQTDAHRRFGGVVPEIASRKHVETITRMMEIAVEDAGVRLSDLSAVAVTQGPGLVGSLIVGIAAAKALSLALGVPLIGVHHIAGHIYAAALVAELEYPAVALVASGGHTELILLEAEGRFRHIGRTRDDAAGEAFDKTARALGLPYPGGPHVDRLAHEADGSIPLPRAWLEPDSYDFSFSGLKTAVLTAMREHLQEKTDGVPDPDFVARLARGFQEAVIDVLVEKSARAAAAFGARRLILAGGVAANRGLRTAMSARCAELGVPLVVPPPELCTDNAVMIAAAAFLKWKKRRFSPLDIRAEPLFSLEAWQSE